MKLGRFLAERRLSQDAFAAEIGVTRVSVSHWVHGRRIPYPRHIIAIDRATGGEVSADDFRHREGKAR
jgi:DNA-binding transcriptional regulator YdaS (Cro superfamily)